MGKVIVVGIRVMYCRVCSNKKLFVFGVSKYDCWVNWGGSLKGMEFDLVVEMLNIKKDDIF